MELLKNLIRTHWLSILLVVVVVYSLQQCSKQQQQKREVQMVLAEKTRELETWVDIAGKHHAKTMGAHLSRQALKENYEKEIEAIEEVHQVELKELETLTVTQTVTRIQVDSIPYTDTVYVEGTPVKLFEWSDEPYVSLSGSVYPDFVTMEHIEVWDSLSIVLAWEREKFWKRTVPKVYAVSENPYTRIVGLRSIDVEGKLPGRISVGPGVFVTLIEGRIVPVLGIGITYSLIRF